MAKYTIETDGIIVDSIQGCLGFPIEICGKRTWVKTDMELTPYTEDSAYAHGYTEAEAKYREVRDELEKQAYQKGYQDAYDTAYKDAEEIYEKGNRVMYQKGLKDAWEAAKKLWDLKGDIIKVFRKYSVFDILDCYTASEVIEKIRQHEQEKEEIIDIDKNKVEALANDIGIHKLYAIVKEIRGERLGQKD